MFLTVLSPQKAADNTEIEEKILSLLSSLHQKLTKVTRSQHFSRHKQARAGFWFVQRLLLLLFVVVVIVVVLVIVVFVVVI